MADHIGSDCAFFIKNKAAFVNGKGDKLNHNFKFRLNTHCILVNPNIHISTKGAYAAITPKKTINSLETALQLPMNNWQSTVINDFESALLPNHPALLELKNQLHAMDAQYVSMSGSGSSFFAFFEEKPTAILFDESYQWKVFDFAI
jgi:4-diphosphocytidyl-2-C-methyl-D-erythritol kinase